MLSTREGPAVFLYLHQWIIYCSSYRLFVWNDALSLNFDNSFSYLRAFKWKSHEMNPSFSSSRPCVSDFVFHHRFQISVSDNNKCSGLENTLVSECVVVVAAFHSAETPKSWSSSRSMGGAGACLALRDKQGTDTPGASRTPPGTSAPFVFFTWLSVHRRNICMTLLPLSSKMSPQRIKEFRLCPQHTEDTILTLFVLPLLSNQNACLPSTN